jgi:hypothetical protein
MKVDTKNHVGNVQRPTAHLARDLFLEYKPIRHCHYQITTPINDRIPFRFQEDTGNSSES